MDTGKLKRFATETRNILMNGVKQRFAALGFNANGAATIEPILYEGGAIFGEEIVSTDFYKKWMSLKNAIQNKSMTDVAEEAAYTWFNRLTAIRIMTKNGLIPPVLQYESDDINVPLIVTEARRGRMPEMDVKQRETINELLKDDSKTDEQFGLLIVAYCHSNKMINKCFGSIADYTELLLPQNILSKNGFLSRLNTTDFITDEDYCSPELIGWLYQFYIAEKKDCVFDSFKKGCKAEAKDIPAATQIFTPNWIVKYMVQNTVGRIYLDNNPDSELKSKMKYLVENNDSGDDDILKFEDLTELKVADLACGSGHILNECFDLLYDMYVEQCYSSRQAVENIFYRNLTGVDIDTRAKQLAQFALLLKACQRDKSFADTHCMPNILDMPRPYREVSGQDIDFVVLRKFIMGDNSDVLDELTQAITLMDEAQNLGSIMKFNISERTRNIVMVRMQEYEAMGHVEDDIRTLMPYMRIILALTEKYSALVMNPPYMGGGNMNEVLSKYVKDNYEKGKADLFSTFMILSIDRLSENGKYGMINMHSWMFLASYEKLRYVFIRKYQIDSMLHLGTHTFVELSGEVVQNTAFVITNCSPYKKSIFYNLCNGECSDKESSYLSKSVVPSTINQNKFLNIPGNTIAYWLNEKYFNIISSNKSLGDISEPRAGLQTSDNLRFLRLWNEVDFRKIGIGLSRDLAITSTYKWFPHNKGGETRKWYGNRDIIINFENDGKELKYWLEHNPQDPTTKSWSRNLRNYPLYFNEGLTWGGMGNTINVRFSPQGSTFDTSGPMLFSSNRMLYILGLTNSNVFDKFVSIFAQGLSKGSGHFAKVPFIDNKSNGVEQLVKQNISISKQDWDSHETSWDFKHNEIALMDERYFLDYIDNEADFYDICIDPAAPKLESLEWRVGVYESNWDINFKRLHRNEEELNRQFIEIYGLQDELTPEVPLDEITILQQGEISIRDNEIVWHDDVVMKQLISYAVGCMMGRYSIDKPGLILANQGDGLKEYNGQVPHSRFDVDDDGIIPLMPSDTEFTDNATLRLKKWLGVVFGEDMLVENINFIEKSLGKSIDDYFVKDFWKDHKRMYQSRPIYWLFSSKKGAFQCLVYMHRMDRYTAEHVRTKYLLPHMEWLTNRQNEMAANEANLTTQERRELDNIVRQIAECREYHDRLHVIADKQIGFDLDDGVAVNYAKFGDVLQKIR